MIHLYAHHIRSEQGKNIGDTQDFSMISYIEGAAFD